MRGTFALTAVADSALALLGRSRARKLSKTALIPALAVGTMAAAATTLRGPGSGRVIAGASTFIASDTLLALGRSAFPAKWTRLTDAGVVATYTLGQWLIHDGLREHDTATERP